MTPNSIIIEFSTSKTRLDCSELHIKEVRRRDRSLGLLALLRIQQEHCVANRFQETHKSN